MEIAGQILVLVLLTMVNAFFSGTEMAVVSVNKNRIKRLAEAGDKRAILILQLSEDSTGFLSTIQVAITFAAFFSSATAATGISQVLGNKMQEWGLPQSDVISMVVVTIILSFFTLVFGELVPKRIALQKAEKFSLIAVRPVYVISKAMKPFIKLLSASTKLVLRLLGMHNDNQEEEVSEEEIRAMLQTGREAGVFNETEQEMITSIFLFDDKKAKEVMTQRQDVVGIDINEPAEKCIEEVLNSRHTKIPVYESEIDKIVGILSMKDYMIHLHENRRGIADIREIMQPPVFVPESKLIDKLFKEMQRDRIRMVVVVDEYGGVSGILTIEDLIEEIVGDLYEEHEEVEEEFMYLGAGHYRVSGKMLLADLQEELHIKIESACDTLSGYLVELLEHIPQAEELPVTIQVEEVEYKILSVQDHAISWVRINMDKDKQQD
jgi:Hemolysins and related proteins containing CBS domains